MKILVCGADGFLGRHFVAHLRRGGHTVTRGVHRPRLPGDIALDYRQDLSPACWLPRLAGVEVVINAVGILRERRAGDFDRLHHRAPAALFEACARLGVRRVLHISALGVTATPYLSSKHAGGDALRRCLPQGVGIAIRPGLVFGNDGASSRLFLALASLPLHAIPRGAGRVQPVHIDDLTALVGHLAEDAESGQTLPRILEVAGPRRLHYAEWLAIYRNGLGLVTARRLPLPTTLTTGIAWLAGAWPGSLLTPATWRLLRAGSHGDPTAAGALLGRPLRDPNVFIDAGDREALRGRALATWRRPVARTALAAIWLITALFSAG